MFKNLIIKRKVLTSMIFILLTLLGVVSYYMLPVELLPSADLPFLVVQLGSTMEMEPEYIEEEIVVPLEGAIGTLEGIDKMDTYISRRGGIIFIYYQQATNIKYAFLKLQQQIDAMKSTLDENFIVMVHKVDTEQLSNMFMNLQVEGPGGLNWIRGIVDDRIEDNLLNIDGIASVQIYGGEEKSVEIIVDESTISANNISLADISSKLNQNQQRKAYLGRVHEGDREIFVNAYAEYEHISDIENIVISKEGPILLKHIADVYVGTKEQTSISRVNGNEAVTIQLIKDSDSNIIELAHKVRSEIDHLNRELENENIEIVIQSDTAQDMEDNINQIIQLAIIGGILAVIILWIFLENVRLAFAVALAIPISIFVAMNFFYSFDITINSLTLIGAALAIGMLLDNSIVVLENIHRLLVNKVKLAEAIIRGTTEVWRSISAATLTTIAIFIPFIFSENFLIKLLGKQIGTAVISTLLISLIVALLLIPMLIHYLLQGKKPFHMNINTDFKSNAITRRYRLFLKTCIRMPAGTIIGAIIIFFISLLISLGSSTQMNEEIETTEFKLYVTMPQGATLDATDKVVFNVEEKIKTLEEKENITSQIYEEDAIVTIKLLENYQKIKDRSLEDIKSDINNRIRDIRTADVSFQEPQSSQRYRGGNRRNPGSELFNILGVSEQMEKIIIRGESYEDMMDVANSIRTYMEDLESINNTSMSIADYRPELQLHFDRNFLYAYNIPLMNIMRELRNFDNEISSGAKYTIDNQEYDIVIKTVEEEDKSINDLERLSIYSATGEKYDLNQISESLLSEGVAQINRVNQEKQIEVSYRFLEEIYDSEKLVESSRTEIRELIAQLAIPENVFIEVTHDTTDLSEFYFLFFLAFALIYMILASIFESIFIPFILITSLPLMVIGAFWAIFITGNSLLNANVLIGFLILLGVVINNGIILIDYARILRSRGYTLNRALILAGQTRVRPILITTITTIIAMLPLAMGEAEYVVHIGAPFAITVIGGLIGGMIYTLLLLPTMYISLEKSLSWIRNLPKITKVSMFSLILLSSIASYLYINSIIWRSAVIVLTFIVIPALFYFIQNSLRRAQTTLIREEDPIKIYLKHIVKIYDNPSRFKREWDRIHKSNGAFDEISINQLIWKIPLFIFSFYFVYIYQENNFWQFLLSHLVYLLGFNLIHDLLNILNQKNLHLIANKIYYWAFPAITLIIFYFQWNSLFSIIVVTLLWGFLLIVYRTGSKLRDEGITFRNKSARVSKIKRLFYEFILVIPMIGKRQKPFKALDTITLDIGKGMFGLLGPNGAGKTTMMRIICGILDQSRGVVKINEFDLNQYREELQGLIGYLPQEFGLYENMTVFEYLEYQAILKNRWNIEERMETVERVIKAVHLDKQRGKKIGALSGGMKQRVGIAQTLLHLPRILVVDEPTAGLDPSERIRFRNLLVELSKDRIVIFSTHIIEDISSSCNKVAVLDKGKLCFWGSPEKMRKDTQGNVWQVHLDRDKFSEIRKELFIVHHIPDGEKVRVRYLAPESKFVDSIQVTPNLEDAYLWLMGRQIQ